MIIRMKKFISMIVAISLFLYAWGINIIPAYAMDDATAVNSDEGEKNATQTDAPNDGPKKLIDVDMTKADCDASEVYDTYVLDVTLTLTYSDLSSEKSAEHIVLDSNYLEWNKTDAYGNKIFMMLDVGNRPEISKKQTMQVMSQFSSYDNPRGVYDTFCPLMLEVRYATPYTEKIVKKATCTEKGVKAVWSRKERDYVYSNIPATGHKLDSAKWYIKRATTEQSGYRLYGQKCSKCGKIKTLKKISLSKINYIYMDYNDYSYTGKKITPEIIVYTDDMKKIPSSNYTVTYINNINIGVASVKVVFDGRYYEGTLTKKFVISPTVPTLNTKCNLKGINLRWTESKGADGYIIYGRRLEKNGWVMRKIADIPSGKITSWTDVYVRKQPGTYIGYSIKAYVKIYGKIWGYSSEEREDSYYDDQKASADIKSITTKKLVLKMNSKQINMGYEVQLSTDSKMRNSITKTVDKSLVKNNTVTITRKFIRNRRYYVRIRTYDIINGVKYYGKWSEKSSFVIPKK